MKGKNVLPVIIALGLLGVSNVSNANAYFTTYVTAKGGYKVNWEHKEYMEENFEEWSKYVSIVSKENSIPVFVRAKAFAGSTYSLQYSGNDWTYHAADDFYYYDNVLKGGEQTSSLRIFIDNIPANPKPGENFNVVVIYETIPVQYDDNGNPLAPTQADWSQGSVVTEESYDAVTTVAPESQELGKENTNE